MPKISYAWMKKNNSKFHPISCQFLDKGDSFQFIRKGAVGDSKNLFKAQHEAAFQAMVREDFPLGVPGEVAHLLAPGS